MKRSNLFLFHGAGCSGLIPRLRRLALLLALAILALAATAAHAYKNNGNVWTQVSGSTASLSFPFTNFAVYKDQLWARVNHGSSAGISFWRSTDGAHWEHLLDDPHSGGVSNYYSNESLIGFNGKLWNLEPPHYKTACTTDGLHWTAFPSANTPYTNYPIVFNNRLWAFTWNYDHNEIWNTADGTSWTAVTSFHTLPLSTLQDPLLASFNGKLWILSWWYGTWSSSNGISWDRVSDKVPWAALGSPSLLTYGNKLWVVSAHELWSTPDGAHWTREQAPPVQHDDTHAVVFKNKIFLFSTEYVFDGSQTYKTQVWKTGLDAGAPVLAPIPAQQVLEHRSFTFEPEVLVGTIPITFSLDQAPVGMTVDPATGVVRWPIATGVGPKTIILRARNADGSSTISLPLTVAYQPPPILSAPEWSKGMSCTIKWTQIGDNKGFIAQIASTPDFATPISTRNISTQTLQCTFNGMGNGTKYYYRVRGNKIPGVTALWSNTVASTQDATLPTGTIKLNGGAASTNSTLVQVSLAASDPGVNPSGVARVSFSGDGVNWTPDDPFTPTHNFRLARTAGLQFVWARFIDRAGNVSLPATASIGLASPMKTTTWIDSNNTAGPWSGIPEHPLRSIQAALDAAQTGDELIAAQGTYKESINFKGKNVILRSSNPLSPDVIHRTIINGNAAGPAVTFAGTETASCTLSGFTITNGKHYDGAGIHGGGTHATIQNNFISNNVYTGKADAEYYHSEAVDHGYWKDVYVMGTFVHVWVPVYITEYWFMARGTGSGISGCNGLIQNNVIAFNTYRTEPGPPTSEHYTYSFRGSALSGCGGTVRNNTIYGNGADEQPAVTSCSAIMQNNIIWENFINLRTQDGNSTPAFCCIQDWKSGGKGNIATDPQMTDPLHNNFSLKATSPCIDAGAAAAGLKTDMAGNARGTIGSTARRGDGSHVDIGAFEYVLPPPVILPAAGSYPTPLTVTMSDAASGAVIRYTTNGAEPNSLSAQYVKPLVLTLSTAKPLVVKARAEVPGLTPSATATQSYRLK